MKHADGFEDLGIPEDLPVTIVSSAVSVSPPVDLSAVLSTNHDFSEWKKRPGSCLVIVNDGTRPTPTAGIMESDEAFFTSPEVSYIVATGAHRGPVDGEWEQIFGKLYERVRERVFVHDARAEAELVHVGTTSFGTEVRLNSIIERFSRILVIGSVEPHYFAGYTGGRKAFLPGIAGYETITANHKFALEPGSGLLKLEGNPVHEDMCEAADLLSGRDIFSIMTVLDPRQEVFALHAGTMDAAFKAAVKDAGRFMSVEAAEPADIIITYAVSPLNRDLYQSHKAVENVRAALKPGGIIILVSECTEGVGESNFYDLLTAGRNPSDVFERIRQGYRLGYHKSASLAGLMRDSQLYAVTGLEPGLLEAAFIRPFGRLQEAIDAALADYRARGNDRPEVLVVPDGSFTAVFSRLS